MNTVFDSQLERIFVEIAQRRSEFLRRGEPKEANKEYDKLHDIKDRMRTLPDRGEAALKRISLNDDPELRILAAAALLALDEPYAASVLKAIAALRLGTKSFEAEMTLKEWRKGTTTEYWS